MNDVDLPYHLALLRAPGVGPAAFVKLLSAFTDIKLLFNSSRSELADYGFKPDLIDYLLAPDWKTVEREVRWQEKPNQRIVTINHSDYPNQLRQISAAPPILFVKGRLEVLNTPQLAIVGARHPTTSGSQTAYNFAEALSASGVTITSGLALGIDGASHEGALAASGKTIAVLGAAIDKIYPARHQALAEKICEHGAIISEFPLGTLPLPEHFPRRNRIISGLSLAVLVIEAAIQSGSLITAKYALEQGRDVFAVPGSIHNPLAKGCHALIKQGAKLIESVADIMEELQLFCHSLNHLQPMFNQSPLDLAALDTHYRKLVECVDFAATPMDIIIQRSGLTVEEVSSMVLLLELQGYLKVVAGGYCRL